MRKEKEREKVAVRKEDEHGTERKTRNVEVGKEERQRQRQMILLQDLVCFFIHCLYKLQDCIICLCNIKHFKVEFESYKTLDMTKLRETSLW